MGPYISFFIGPFIEVSSDLFVNHKISQYNKITVGMQEIS